MAHIVTITITGGAFDGEDEDTKISINADNISKITDTDKEDEELGNSVIFMTDNKRYNVNETREELTKLINKK